MSRIYIVARGVYIFDWSSGEKEWGREVFGEIITPSFPNLVKYVNLQMLKAHKTPSRLNMKKYGEAHHNEITECQK